ncbi:MAG: hypothetical protein GY807_05140 [Gammaproteobacteria bacterium]|nr:hypothetical protein [Gammaproteobacteria bacterium]
MLEIERLIDTNKKLIRQLREGGLDALDKVLNTTRKTAATYRYSYDRYLQYFRDKPAGEDLTEQDLYVGFGFAYSWMATIKQLDPRIKIIDSAVDALNEVRSIHPADLGPGKIKTGTISNDEVLRIQRTIEPIRQFLGSVTGSSKLLHFVNPEIFPIWDVTIHGYCDQNHLKNSSDSLQRYVRHTFNVHSLINDASFNEIIYHPLTKALNQAHETVRDQYRIPDPMSKVRSAEFLMFFGGRLERIQQTPTFGSKKAWKQGQKMRATP